MRAGGIAVCFAAAAAALACGEKTSSSIQCGAGTTLKGDRCVPACGAGTVLADGVCVSAAPATQPSEPAPATPSPELPALADRMCACQTAACVEGVRIELDKRNIASVGPDGKRLLDCALRQAAAKALSDAAKTAEATGGVNDVNDAELEKARLQIAEARERRRKMLERAEAEASKPVTVQAFKTRFRATGKLLERLSKVAPTEAAGLKRLYNPIASNYSNAMRDDHTRTRLHRTLGTIRARARRALSKHSKKAEREWGETLQPFD